MKKLLVLLLVTLGSSFFTLCDGQYTDLLNFNVTNGAYPSGALIIAGNKLYGMAVAGGANDDGCIFSLDTDGTGYKDILDFNVTNGKYPIGSLTMSGKCLYGLALYGGANDSGCIFVIDTNGGNYRDLFDFTGTNGKWPCGTLTLYKNTLYGMTSAGGINTFGCIFSIDTNGSSYRDLFDFNDTNGAYPDGDLTISGKTLFGMTQAGGALMQGNVFSIDTNGSNFKDLSDFNGVIGQYPYGSLTLSTSGTILYGMTYSGGGNISSQGVVFSIDTAGTNFKDILEFNGNDGENPALSELKFSNHLLYGMTKIGGAHSDGVIFSIDTAGNNYKDLWDFNGTTGALPLGSLTLSGNTMYGMTEYGGTIDSGVVFKFRDTVSNITSSINTLNKNQGEINVYPNPSNGMFIFQLSVVSGQLSVEVYNMLGEKVYSQAIAHTSRPNSSSGQASFIVDLSSQPNGVYLYRVISEDGSLTGEGKLVIEK